MVNRWHLAVLSLLFGLAACREAEPSPQTVKTAPSENQDAQAAQFQAPQIPVVAEKRVLQTITLNLDKDVEDEQLIFLQTKSNLSLPIEFVAADYDVQRKTWYQAWDGVLLASASQPFNVRVEPLIADDQKEIAVAGFSETNRPTLEILRLVAGSGLGLQYTTVFQKESRGTIDLQWDPEAGTSAAIVLEEPDPRSQDPLDAVRTTWQWRFQTSQYEAVQSTPFRRASQPDSALEKLFSGDNGDLENFLQGPWVKTTTDKKDSPLLLFFDRKNRELVFANLKSQEVYHWEQSVRTLRNALYVTGSNDLISLIKLQMSVAIVTDGSIEINSPENPNWTGSYGKLGNSAALALTKTTLPDPRQPVAPSGLYRNDKGESFDFQFPEIFLTLEGQSWTGFGALHDFSGVTVLQVKVAGSDGKPVFSKAYSFALTEEATSSRIVRTVKLLEGRMTIDGWVKGSTDTLRLEQVEILSGSNR